MDKKTRLAPRPKSLADILAEELDGELGDEQTQELPVVEKQARLKAVYERIHQEQPARSALCLSGGGIRSAIFGLGILQGLAKTRLLGAFDYLSTVSGGGYVGGWLIAWIKNHPGGADGVFEELQRRPDSTLNPEPQPIRHLRSYSNYLTPKTGLTSVDTWTLIATYVRNMFLNWLVLISWLAAAMMIPRLHLAAILLPPEGWYSSPDYLQILHRYEVGLTILLVIGFLLIAVAMAYSILDVPSTGNARFSQGRFLKYRQLPLLLASLVLTEWWALFRNIYGDIPFKPRDVLWKFIVFAIASYLAGGLLALAASLFARRQARPKRIVPSLWRLFTILLTTAFGGLCLWAIATRLFWVPAGNAINYVCFAPALVLAILLLVNFLFTGLASDAGQDFDYVFEDLGNAIRKIRIDLGIPIDIKVLSPKKSEGTINHCAFGTINYSALDGPGTDGSFIYIKPVVSGDEPPDVANYAAAHPEFPHEPTTDQWFGESQLESYRLLGLHAVEVICGKDWQPSTLPLFFDKVKKDLAVTNA